MLSSCRYCHSCHGNSKGNKRHCGGTRSTASAARLGCGGTSSASHWCRRGSRCSWGSTSGSRTAVELHTAGAELGRVGNALVDLERGGGACAGAVGVFVDLERAAGASTLHLVAGVRNLATARIRYSVAASAKRRKNTMSLSSFSPCIHLMKAGLLPTQKLEYCSVYTQLHSQY